MSGDMAITGQMRKARM